MKSAGAGGLRRLSMRVAAEVSAASFVIAIHGCAEPTPSARPPLPTPGVTALANAGPESASSETPTRPTLAGSSPPSLTPSSSAAPPTPSLSPNQAAECAAKAARDIVAQPTLKPAPSTDPATHWFTFEARRGQSLSVAVEDATCVASIAPEVGSDVRFDDASAKRFLTLRKRAIAVVQSDAEVKSICKRLERLKTKHVNLKGCVKWLEYFPSDLCNHPPPAPIGPPEGHLEQALQHECHWRFYFGESMTTHTSRHFTLIVDAHRGRLVGVWSTAGRAFGARAWRGAPTARRQLRTRLRREAVIREACGKISECPTVGHMSSSCGTESCFVVTLDPGRTVEMEALHGRPTRVFEGGDEAGMTYAAWLKKVATTPQGPPPPSR